MLVKGMASGNLIEAHIMVKRYWFLDLVFGKGPTKSTRGLLAKQSDCFCMAKTKRPKRKMVLAAYNRKKILPRYPVNLKLY